MLHRLLIIEHESLVSDLSLGHLLAQEEEFCCDRIKWGSFLPERLDRFTTQLVVAVTVSEPHKSLSFFNWLRSHSIGIPTLAILPSSPDEELFRTAFQAVEDIILWPVRKEELRFRLSRILGIERYDEESVNHRLREELGLAQLVGDDSVFFEAIEKVPLIAAIDAPVLLSGETGTGKELCAQAIHNLSRRHSCPFIPVECGAVPEHLVENELFGHARGAFTDAHADQRGLVAMAEGGTLFLDEIDALSVGAQAKLLRFLQEGIYRPLGAERFLRADVRIIAATNRDLEACMAQRQFRTDLYFRLNVLRLHLPPLRQRGEDIALLARHFLQSICETTGLQRKSFSPAALRMLQCYDWPGNVRELFNVVQRTVLFCQVSQVLPRHVLLTPASNTSQASAASFRQARVRAIETFERLYVEEMIRKHSGNITRAALEAGKDRRGFGRLVKKYQIDRQARNEPGRF